MVLWLLKNLEPRFLLRTMSLVSKKMKRLCDADDLWYGKMVQSQVISMIQSFCTGLHRLNHFAGDLRMPWCSPPSRPSPILLKLTRCITQWIVDQEVRDTWCGGLGAKKAFRVLCQVGWLQGSWVLEERPRGGILHCCLKADGIFASVRSTLGSGVAAFCERL
jgi:hypothetical protein